MFQRNELEQLRLQKQRLVSQSDANRLRLTSDWQRLQSLEGWLDEILKAGRRHPLWIMTLATAAGTLAAKTLRRPRTVMNGIGRLGKLVSVALLVWRLYRRKSRQS
jgi:hypothetical protein